MALFEARHIAASYTRAGETAQLFSDVCFVLEEGRIYDLIGSSGSGKSTLLKICALMIKRERGDLFLDNKESATFEPTVWRRQVCLVPQIPTLITGTVRDNLLFPWKLKVHAGQTPPDETTLISLLERAELVDIELDRDVSQLSGGQVARVALLRAFATKPQVLLLDEVDASLDDESASAIGRLTNSLVDKGIACLRIRHRKADGFASGTFTLKDSVLSYASHVADLKKANPPTLDPQTLDPPTPSSLSEEVARS
ncbi:MAG: ATP-binding cassette domain-containing protein [Eggerthellaceae bacterium]|jgi:putative ABC transport system ATP-binding protein|nr:ATP-binding cassette domain-containing protein [Eggerthellaceae bacterium]MDR2721944.1 ATP-binding cassette domain-containing protein [Coriobacteriaceae bacterium]